MFKSYDHFKKATKIVYDNLKTNRNIKLSEFRNLFLEQTEHKNIQSYSASFDKPSNTKLDIESAEIKTVSVIIMDDDVIRIKVDFLDNEIGRASANAFYIAHVKQYAYENYPNPEFALKIAERSFYHINNDCLALTPNGKTIIKIVHSTDYGLKDTEEHKYSEMTEWNLLAMDNNNLPPVSNKRINVKDLTTQNIDDSEILFASSIARSFMSLPVNFKSEQKEHLYGSLEKWKKIDDALKKDKDTTPVQYASITNSKLIFNENKIKTFKPSELVEENIEPTRKKIIKYLPSFENEINLIDNIELLLLIESYAKSFSKEFNSISEKELAKLVWKQVGFTDRN